MRPFTKAIIAAIQQPSAGFKGRPLHRLSLCAIFTPREALTKFRVSGVFVTTQEYLPVVNTGSTARAAQAAQE